MIWLELPPRLEPLVQMAHQVAEHVLRPISRKYDRAEHVYPKELDTLRAMIDGMGEAGGLGGAGASGARRGARDDNGGPRNGASMATVLGLMELSWGDIGLALSLPGQGLGNAAIAAVADDAQRARFGPKWAAMAITEPEAGSDSAAIRTTARPDGDGWILEGEKIFVTAGSRADAVVVWATIDPRQGRAAIKPFVVEKGTPGMEIVRLDKKLGIRASDTAVLRFSGCRIPRENLLGSPDIAPEKGFGGVMQTFDNTRPLVAAMAIGVARAALERTRVLLAAEGFRPDHRTPLHRQRAAEAELLRMEAEIEASRLLALKAAFMADNGMPNALEASTAKAKAARVATMVTLRCVELAGATGYGEDELLEKWARDSKILDIFEGTQQIQLLIIARRLLGKRSTELR